MLPEIGASELLVIAVVALIVVGPKDLPLLLRKVGQFMARLRGMASEFRASFDEMARQSELDELRKEVAAMRSGQYMADAAGSAEMTSTFDDINRSLTDAGVQLEPAIPYQFAQLEEAPLAAAHAEPAPKARKRRTASTVEAAPKAPAKPRARKVAPKAPPS